MKKFLNQIWDKMNEPRNEKLLLILLPCIAILLAGCILLPRFVAIAADRAGISAESAPPQSIVDSGESELKASTIEEILVFTPTASPTSILEPSPEPEFEKDWGWKELDGKTYYLYENYSHAIGLETIEGRQYYFDQNGVKAKKLGIDVSFYNKGINWEAVKADGIDFAIIRAGGRGWESGLIYDDENFINNLMAARKAGIDVGIYFYSTAITPKEAEQEALYVLKLLNGTELEYPIFIDIEQSGEYPQGRSDRLSKTSRADTVKSFCETVKAHGYKAGVYSGAYFFNINVAYESMSQYYIWIANYTKNNRLPSFRHSYDMWQFTDRATVNGVRGMVDMNVVF